MHSPAPLLSLLLVLGTGLVVLVLGRLLLRRGSGTTLRQRVRGYVGEIDPHTALLTPATRPLVELAGAICGFPGLGWLISGRVAVGLVLLIAVPAVVWAFYPVYLTVSGRLAESGFAAARYLPALAVVSAGSLAAVEWHDRRKQP